MPSLNPTPCQKMSLQGKATGLEEEASPDLFLLQCFLLGGCFFLLHRGTWWDVPHPHSGTILESTNSPHYIEIHACWQKRWGLHPVSQGSRWKGDAATHVARWMGRHIFICSSVLLIGYHAWFYLNISGPGPQNGEIKMQRKRLFGLG